MADALRQSGDREALALWDGPDYKRLVEIAEEAGASGFVALDLRTEIAEPGSISRLPDGGPGC